MLPSTLLVILSAWLSAVTKSANCCFSESTIARRFVWLSSRILDCATCSILPILLSFLLMGKGVGTEDNFVPWSNFSLCFELFLVSTLFAASDKPYFPSTPRLNLSKDTLGTRDRIRNPLFCPVKTLRASSGMIRSTNSCLDGLNPLVLSVSFDSVLRWANPWIFYLNLFFPRS